MSNKNERINNLAVDILNLSKNTLVINLRFMDKAISMLKLKKIEKLNGLAVDGSNIYYNPAFVLKSFSEEHRKTARQYLHMVLHCVYQHFWVSAFTNQECWNLACDIAVEYTINDMEIAAVEISVVEEQKNEIERLKENVKYMTADWLYKYFITTHTTEREIERLRKLFFVDDHREWYSRTLKEELSLSVGGAGDGEKISLEKLEQIGLEWKDVAKQMKMDLETFSKQKGDHAGCLTQNLIAVTRERYDYADFLKKFTVLGERMKINDDEFDYIFYTYGLKLYEKMPLIEPLEYKEVKQIKEFVIAIDTSGSTSGKLVQTFVQKTYNMLKQEENFFTKFNIHIIQCDADIQEDAKITNQREFDDYLANMKLLGNGGTDFRPVFSYVDELIAKHEFTNLKGMIYFTDGFGTFPSKQPDYHVAFIYVEEGYENPKVPVWAMKLILQPDDIREI